MRNKVLLAFAFVALLAAPAFAAVQNVRVSGDIDSTYINRNHFDLGEKTTTGTTQADLLGLIDQSVFITQTRLRVDADLSDSVSTTIGLINERAWTAEDSGNENTDVNLYLAYATLREFLYSPLTVSVGRQVFHYGNGLVIGDGGPNNSATGNLATVAADLTKRTSYDGVKATLDYKPLTLDLIYFKNSAGVVTGVAGAGRDDSDVYGINANYNLGDSMNTVVEGYMFSRINGDNGSTSSASTRGDTLFVPGLRVSTNPVAGLNAQVEVAWQGGRRVTTAATGVGGATVDTNQRRNAMAAQVMASYTLPVLEQYKPMVNGSYTYVSGDKNAAAARVVPSGTGSADPASGDTFQAWDPLNEAQGSGTIYNSLFNLTNLHIIALGASATPAEDVTASFLWSSLRASKSYLLGQNVLTFSQPDGSSLDGAVAYTQSRQIGNEYDVNVNYAYTEDVTFGVSLGWFIPGRMFREANDSTASQALAHVLVNF